MKKYFFASVLLSGLAFSGSSQAKDIDLEAHVRKYWTNYQNKKVEIADGNKNWPVTPELKAERLAHFEAALLRFAPHFVKEAELIDRVFGWKKGTYLGIMRFGAKTSVKEEASSHNPSHECTSWITMDNLTDGKTIIMHKNRDSNGRPLAVMRRAVSGKHAWIGNGSQKGLFPTQGINDRGVVVMMNSGDMQPEADNSQYGISTGIICRILLEECGTAKAAVELLEKIVMDNAYTHVDSGSIWFIGDASGVFITEQSARKAVTKPVISGFVARANAYHYPEMLIFSLRSAKSLIAHNSREAMIREFLLNKQFRSNGVITALDNAAASRIDNVVDAPKCYPPCGRKTISGNTFTIDKEYPEYLSSAYMALSWPRSSVYLPIPILLDEVPEVLLDGKLSMKSFELMDKKQPLLPDNELNALEAKLYKRHAEAVEKARAILRTSTKHTAVSDARAILKKAFLENLEDWKKAYKN